MTQKQIEHAAEAILDKHVGNLIPAGRVYKKLIEAMVEFKQSGAALTAPSAGVTWRRANEHDIHSDPKTIVREITTRRTVDHDWFIQAIERNTVDLTKYEWLDESRSAFVATAPSAGVWVKASERMPEKPTDYKWQYADEDEPGIIFVNWKHSCAHVYYHSLGYEPQLMVDDKEWFLSDWYWLDESRSASQPGVKGVTYEQVKKILDVCITTDEAIESIMRLYKETGAFDLADMIETYQKGYTDGLDGKASVEKFLNKRFGVPIDESPSLPPDGVQGLVEALIYAVEDWYKENDIDSSERLRDAWYNYKKANP